MVKREAPPPLHHDVMMVVRSIISALLLALLSLWPDLGVTQEVQKFGGYRLKLSVETTASKADVWALWSDVSRWKEYDKIVEFVELQDDAPFAKGSVGFVKTTKAPRTRFTLIEVTEGASFTEELHLPLGQSILLKRYFEQPEIQDGGASTKTLFTHEVVFKGRLRSLVYWLSAKSFRNDMPNVMANLKALAELESVREPR